MNKHIAVFATCALLAVMLTGCKGQEPTPTEPPMTQQTDMTGPASTAGTVQATQPAVKNAIAVQTQYGYLFYQDQWEDSMVVTQTDGADCLTVAFEAQINEIRYPLFRLMIGQCEGDPVGYLTDGAGNRNPVFVYPDEIGEYAELTEGEQNRLYAMQEEINFIIENLK